jgi:hypothetical protein
MNQEETAVDVFPAFPTPIIIREVPNFYKVKDDFIKDIREYVEENVNVTTENIFNLLKFQKYFPLIYSEIETSLSPVIDDLNIISPSSIVRSDVSVIKPNGYIEPQVRSEYDITGILVVDCPFRFSGDFVFLSQHHNHFFHRILNKNMKDMYFSTNVNIPSADGRLIIFPSTLTYYSEPNKTDLDKIVISFDIKL